MTRDMLIPWTMHTPDGVRRVWLDPSTGLTRRNLLGGDVSFDDAAARALAQTALLSASLVRVADVGPLRAVRERATQ